jgi:hypothetical protein
MNYHSILFILFLASIRLPSIAQIYQNQPEYEHFPCPESYPGCYESYKDFIAGNPVVTSGFQMEKRNSNEIRDSRAGGYLLKFDAGVPHVITKTDHIWGVYYRDTLYINRKFFQGKKGFDKVYCLGSYGYFHGINPNSGADSDNDIFTSALLFGLVGGIVASAVDGQNNNLYGKFPHVMIYLLDYETGMVSPLTSFKLEKILEDDQQLLDLYEKEQHRSSMMVMHAYLDTFAERHKNK